MSALKKMVRGIETVSETSGRIGKWCALGLVIVGSYDTVARHVFNAPTEWGYDTICMIGGTMYLLGASYDYLHDAHTRVDLIYSRLGLRGKAILNALAALLFFFPLMGTLLKYAVDWAVRAWKVNEVMFTSFWYPPAFPYRSIVALGLLLLVLQGIARFIRDLHIILRGERLD